MTTLAAAVLSALYGEAAAVPAASEDNALQEVVVTATRREMSAQDLPISITAVTGASLEQAGINDISGLAHSMAGVNVTDKGPFGGVNGATLIIRGLNSEATGGQVALATPIVPPVATYVDDTALFVNLRLQDLDHVEILRGPQGTLYGSGSLGGTIRFVQNAPDPMAFDAKIEAGASKTQHTHALNEDVSGMLNLPLSDTLAVRLNASWTDDAGFINQPHLYALDSSGAPLAQQPGVLLSNPVEYSKDGTNSYQYRTARVATLWKPSDAFKAQLSYYYQISRANGFPQIAPEYGLNALSSADHTQASTHDKVDLFALTLEGDLGFATLTSNTSYGHHTNQSSTDLTNLYSHFSFYNAYYGANPRVLVTGHDLLDDKPWAQELRLASKTGGRFDWVGGLFFKNETTIINEHEFYPGYNAYFNACAPVYGVGGSPFSQCGLGDSYVPGPTQYVQGIPIVKDQAYIGDFETHFKDMAAFGEVTAHITPDWSVTGGTRVFKQTLSQSQQTGLLFGASIPEPDTPVSNRSLNDSWRKALWKVNTSYQIDRTNLVYATWSQGFRRGSVNALPERELGGTYVTDPRLFRVEPDKADNYEIGAKGTIDNRFRYSAAIYDIQWHNVQEGAQLTPLVLPAGINVGNAYSRGVEMEFYLKMTEHLSGQLEYTYDQTKLTSFSDVAAAGLSVPPPAAGGPLPGTPKSSLALGLEYGHIELAGGEMRYAVNAHYQSSLIPALSATIPTVAGYTMVDARASYSLTHWMGTIYVDNLTNRLGINSYSDPANYGTNYQAIVSRPRTYGFTVGYSFKGW
ncbi:MAG: iron complex outerrane recepter protein [Gammaproteobacteria bacterium]|nr:iron complex outerrane recepter protein [Gammaproteobacteria bacterium]